MTSPIAKVLEPGYANYSHLAVLPDGTILCLYGCGIQNGDFHRSRSLTLTRFNYAWLTDTVDTTGAAR